MFFVINFSDAKTILTSGHRTYAPDVTDKTGYMDNLATAAIQAHNLEVISPILWHMVTEPAVTKNTIHEFLMMFKDYGTPFSGMQTFKQTKS